MKVRIVILLLFMASLSVPMARIPGKISNLPVSREAVIIEYSSPTEVMVKATGYGFDYKHLRPRAKELDRNANIDAKRAAIWYLLFAGTDPIIKSSDEKEKFAKIQDEFFCLENINHFVVWESDNYEERIKLDNGKKLKIVKVFKVNIKLIKDYLVSRGVIEAEKEIMDMVGLPQIMVIPEVKESETAVELLSRDPIVRKGAEAIEQSLTARGFEVVVPEQISAINELLVSQLSMMDENPDPAYLFALSIGSDVYITFNIASSSRRIGSTTVKKYVVACRAYETTTARLLGTEIGYSKERPAQDAALVEEAVNNAIGKVLDRIVSYWRDDVSRGIQYRLLISLDGNFGKDQAEEVFYSIRELLGKMGTFKENIISNNIYDLIIWVDKNKYPGAFDVYMYLERNYASWGTVEKVSLNRKLLFLKVRKGE